MSAKQSYTFTVLRYVHDVATGEFVNMGIVLFSPGSGFLKAIVRKSYGRVTHFFPGSNGEDVKRTVSAIESRINTIAKEYGQQARLNIDVETPNALKIASRVIPPDDSALQWSELQGGLSSEPAVTAERLFERFVRRYDVRPKHERRSDDQVWREFSRVLEVRRLDEQLQEHDISSPVETVHFKHALKNGKWHLLEPVSFDLIDGDWIKNKAKQLLGQMMVLKDSSREDFKLYILVGEPKHGDVSKDYAIAMRYLSQIPINHAIYTDSDAGRFANDIDAVMSHAN